MKSRRGNCGGMRLAAAVAMLLMVAPVVLADEAASETRSYSSAVGVTAAGGLVTIGTPAIKFVAPHDSESLFLKVEDDVSEHVSFSYCNDKNRDGQCGRGGEFLYECTDACEAPSWFHSPRAGDEILVAVHTVGVWPAGCSLCVSTGVRGNVTLTFP